MMEIIQFEYRKIRTRNKSVFGHFSCNALHKEDVLEDADKSEQEKKPLIDIINKLTIIPTPDNKQVNTPIPKEHKDDTRV